MRDDEVIAELERALGVRLEARPSELPADGPRTWWIGDGVVAWSATEARVRDELAGIARGAAHPLAPRVLGHTARAIALAATPEAPEDALETLIASAPREVRTIEATVRAHLESIASPVSVPRALARIVGRARTDRLLARTLRVTTRVGPILGGVHPGWLRRAEGRVASLSMRHAQREGWSAIDLAAPETFGLGSLREEDDVAYDLALLAALAREATLARGDDAEDAAERARDVVDRLLPRETARVVRVRVEGPAWLDASRWTGELPASQARWALRELDGLALGGEIVRVHVDPPLRPGRAAPPWRPRDERRRELFSRWDRGIQADDEGLFSATPEALAERIAEGAHGVVIDGTCGIGSIAIALARRPEVREVIAVDLDASRLAMAAHNARIYDVASRIRFVRGDVREVIARERADVLVLDPPWGGRDYDRSRVVAEALPLDVRPLIAAFEGAIVLKLPRSFDVRTLPPGFVTEPGIDGRGVIKMLIARRAARRPAGG
ncbi:trimethylguanosine synthase [Sandaracinus amylolyticus]|uniref:trimethylguanosine synthase n=1 Tax=Sandaracinus amylolyticus TaxID=927083 RepID=UPI001F26F60C|nr:trimethylguanosine synthase [Sandaracinus amylolyticus]UJR82545.1 Hypothetical protein I5071_46100 [Sandaracinus amylolyticus]